MGRFGSITVPEAEAFLIAFDEMLNRTKTPTQPLPVANFTQQNYYSNDRGGGCRGRGAGRFQRGGRNSWQAPRTLCQICGRGGHGAYNCYFRFDQNYTPSTTQQAPSAPIPYSNSTPPPPPTSFHQPRAYVTAPPQLSDSVWYPDSGASHHVTNDLTNFTTAQPATNPNDQLIVGYTRPPSPGNH
ncbi:hypothetical protein PIB30_118604 [Stylosanthes scabra]|uniref:CCHC-type domain-containing protein n=1 Tax=Stylosanthes scabra TaxID=79078 RepID=A0ABU6YA17_9FABA|nr:hypothetical protein [Stylosanthes scabra]